MNDDLSGQQVLRRYRIIQPLGQGGMGVVYLARTEGAEGFTKPVVVKSLLPALLERSDMANLFVREARILSNLSHPGIVRVLDFGREGRRYLMVLEYVNGYDLGRWRRFLTKTDQRVPVNLAVHIIYQVLGALQYAHTARRGDGTSLTTVHRDVSPSNILLSDAGQVRLVDFGIASVLSDFGEETQKGGFKGKFVYAAPELLERGSPTPKSDLYAAAVVLYQLIAGRNPFHAPTDAEVVRRVKTLEIPPLQMARADVSTRLEEVVRTAMSRSPKDRFTSAADFANALRQSQDAPEDQLRQVLAASLRSDFYGKLPETMNVERLEARDQAWRTVAVPDNSDPKGKARASEPGRASVPETIVRRVQTKPLKLPTLSSRQRERRRRLGILVLLPSAAIAAALLGWSLTEPAPRSEPLQPPATVPAETDARTHRARPALSGESSLLPNARDDVPETTLRPSQASKLAATVGAHSGLIADCYRLHAIAPLPKEIRLGFRLMPDGRVHRVTLVPPGLAATEFGTCLAVGFRAVAFGSQGRSLKFHIPVQLGPVLLAHGFPLDPPK